MKVFKFKHKEIFISESALVDLNFIELYNKLLDDLLLIRTISDKRIYQAINLCTNRISSKPFITEPLLRKKTLPPFQFLLCSN